MPPNSARSGFGRPGDLFGLGRERRSLSPNDGATSATGATGTNPGQTFAQTLQSMGVTPEQFRTDFLAAIKQVMGGQAGTTAAPTTGLALDTAA